MNRVKIFSMMIIVAAGVFVFGRQSCALPEKKPLLMAHRGGNVETDENTISSYANAIKLGMDVIECDPRPTKDGVFVIMHDADVARTTDGKGKVADMTLAEIQALKTKSGQGVPLFEDVLNLAKKGGVMVYVDTKQLDNAYMAGVADIIVKTGMEKSVIFGLWSVEQLRWVRKNHPEMGASIPFPAPVSSMATAKKLGAVWIGTMIERATPEMLAKAEAAGLKVVTFEINDRESILRKINDGMQVIQTDDPKLLRQIVDELWLEK